MLTLFADVFYSVYMYDFGIAFYLSSLAVWKHFEIGDISIESRIGKPDGFILNVCSKGHFGKQSFNLVPRQLLGAERKESGLWGRDWQSLHSRWWNRYFFYSTYKKSSHRLTSTFPPRFDYIFCFISQQDFRKMYKVLKTSPPKGSWMHF